MTPKFKFALTEELKDKKEFLPTKAEPKATGWDVRTTKNFIISPFDHVKIPLGFRTLCPEGWWFELKPRSSIFAKKNLHALYGTIDESYEGELIFACQYIPKIKFSPIGMPDKRPDPYAVHWDATMYNTLKIEAGDAVGQIIPVKRQEMEVIELTNAEIEEEFKNRAAIRGAGGFGSTDDKK